MKLSQTATKTAIGGVAAISIVLGVIYSLQEPSAIPESATGFDRVTLENLRQGTMKKLIFQDPPKDVSQAIFTDPDGGEHQLSDWQGKYIALNFWATWCAPCRKEMSSLAALQSEFGGDKFEVVTIATGRNSVPAINRFFAEIEVTNLPILLDAGQKLARNMAVLGLPITVILNPEGQEIARLRGDAEWYSNSARAIIEAMTAPGADG